MQRAYACLAVLLAAACSSSPRVNVDPETGRTDVDVEPVGQRGERWNANLQAMGGSGVTGHSTANVGDDMTHVVVHVMGGSAGATYPWHVHEGECTDAGAPIVGPASAYPALRPGADGMANAAAHLAGIQLNEAKKYHVNVHASPTDLGTIISCGNLDD